MQSRKTAPLFILLAGMMILSACAPAAAPTPQTVEVTRIVAGTPEIQVITATAAPAQPPAATPLPAGSVQINGAGATFPLPLYTEWTYAYQYVDPAVAINYQGIGSGGGKKAIIDGTVDFAGSDSLVSDAEYASGKDLQMLPAVAGAVVPIYNIKFNAAAASNANPTPTAAPTPSLILDRQTLVDIYNAKVTKWNDPAIVKLNPGLANRLPDAPISVVHRSDGSGTTEMFTKALTSFSPDWKAGGAQSVEWPVDKAGNGLGAKGNPGVAAAVINTPNSIGYVELNYAIANNIAYSQIVNKAGQTVTANGESLASAMNDFADKFTDKLTNVIVDGAGAKSWPISGYTYYVLHMTSMSDCTKAQKLLEYIQWTLTDAGAAKTANKLGYAVLPADVQKAVIAKLGEVQCSGKPVLTK
jgi:phosphate transport system substrate-binding protein